MTILLSMLPFYLLGNLHCLGMCGPLVMMISQHRYHYYYHVGRILAFSFAGAVAGGIGAVANVFFHHFHLSAITSFGFGGIILLIGLSTLTHWRLPGGEKLAKLLAPFNQHVAILMLRDQKWPTFLFGLLTIALPCGQSLVVFSACALSGSMGVGMLNGFCFALLTSPALVFAMTSHQLLHRWKAYYNIFLGWSALLIGSLALCRGFAEVGWIPHLILNADSEYHFVIF